MDASNDRRCCFRSKRKFQNETFFPFFVPIPTPYHTYMYLHTYEYVNANVIWKHSLPPLAFFAIPALPPPHCLTAVTRF